MQLRPRNRLVIHLALAAGLALTPARAVHSAPARDASTGAVWKQHRQAALVSYEQAEGLHSRKDPSAAAAFSDAARSFAAAADALPEGLKNRVATAEALYRQSLRATELAVRDLAPDAACSEATQQWLREALATCEAFLGLIERSFGTDALDAYGDIARMLREFKRTLADCAAQPASISAPPLLPMTRLPKSRARCSTRRGPRCRRPRRPVPRAGRTSGCGPRSR